MQYLILQIQRSVQLKVYIKKISQDLEGADSVQKWPSYCWPQSYVSLT